MKHNTKIILLIAVIIIFATCTTLYHERHHFKRIKNVYDFYSSNEDVDFYFDNYGKTVTFQSDGLTIIGTLYVPKRNVGNELHPGVVLVHGETPIGRKLPIYRILAKKLVERGYIVLTYDRRGIGESDDPERIELVESWDESNDIFQAVSYIYSIKNIDKSKIYAIGHSGGSFSVMQAGLRDKRIKKIVVIGPPRRIEERVLNRSSPDLQYLYERKSRCRGLQKPIPLDIFLSIISDLKLLYDEYTVSDHIPIFLIDGELENYEDKLYLRNYFSELKEPKKYHTVNGTGHYLNTSYVADFMLYNNKVMNETVNSLDNWFNSN